MDKRQFNVRSLLWLTTTLAAFLGAVTTTGIGRPIHTESFLDFIRVVGWWKYAVIVSTLPILCGIAEGKPWWGVLAAGMCVLTSFAVALFLPF